MANNLKKYEVNIRGKQYLTVAGRVALAHDEGRLLGATFKHLDSTTPFRDGEEELGDYIAVKSTVKVFNKQNLDIVRELLNVTPLKADKPESLPYPIAALVQDLLISEYEGVAKSPREGSPAWKALPPNAPERSNPLEVCATSALGRALGAAGFGDSESFATADEVIVAQTRQESYGEGTYSSRASASKGPSDKQKKYLATLVKQRIGISTPEQFGALVQQKFGKGIDDLSARDVSEWIDALAKDGEAPF